MDFFRHEAHLRILHDILARQYATRVLEYFLQHYAKHHNVIYHLPDGTLIDVYTEYRNMVTSKKKRNFDVFRRRERLLLNYVLDGQRHTFETTHAQLNFYQWAIEVRLFDYFASVYDDVRGEINTRGLNSRSHSSGHVPILRL